MKHNKLNSLNGFLSGLHTDVMLKSSLVPASHDLFMFVFDCYSLLCVLFDIHPFPIPTSGIYDWTRPRQDCSWCPSSPLHELPIFWFWHNIFLSLGGQTGLLWYFLSNKVLCQSGTLQCQVCDCGQAAELTMTWVWQPLPSGNVLICAVCAASELEAWTNAFAVLLSFVLHFPVTDKEHSYCHHCPTLQLPLPLLGMCLSWRKADSVSYEPGSNIRVFGAVGKALPLEGHCLYLVLLRPVTWKPLQGSATWVILLFLCREHSLGLMSVCCTVHNGATRGKWFQELAKE